MYRFAHVIERLNSPRASHIYTRYTRIDCNSSKGNDENFSSPKVEINLFSIAKIISLILAIDYILLKDHWIYI